MDGFDIYGDLEVVHAQETQKAIDDLQWKEKYQVALSTIQKIQAEKKELNKKLKQLEINFVSLLDTARTEIKRKDKQICELRKEIDDICFRRNRPRPGRPFDEIADVGKDVKSAKVHVNPFSSEPIRRISSYTDKNPIDDNFLTKSLSEQIGDNKRKFDKSKGPNLDTKNHREKDKRRKRSRDRSYDRSRHRKRSKDRLVDRSRNRSEASIGDKHNDQLKVRKSKRSKGRSKERRDEKTNKKRKRHDRGISISEIESSDGSWDGADYKNNRSSQRTNYPNKRTKSTTANGFEPSKVEDKPKDTSIINTGNDYRKEPSEESKTENHLHNVPKPSIENRVHQKIEILQIEILKDVKELKKKQIEAEKIKKPDPVDPIKAATEKSNQFLDALFDDSIMNQSEHNEDLYNDLGEVPQQTHSDFDNTKKENFTKPDENCNFKFQTPQKLSVTKLLDDLFGPSPADSLCDVVGRKNSVNSVVEASSDLDFVLIPKPESSHKSGTTQRKADTTVAQVVIDSSSYDDKQRNSKEKSSDGCLELKALEKGDSKIMESQVDKAETFKFAELDSSFYSSEDEAKVEKENVVNLINTSQSDIDYLPFEKESLVLSNQIQASDAETICNTHKMAFETGKNDSVTHSIVLPENDVNETNFNCKKPDNVEDSTEKYKDNSKEKIKNDYIEKSYKSSHAEKQNLLSEKNNDKEENNKKDYAQKQSYSSKHNKSSHNSKSRSSPDKDTHRSSSSRSKTEKYRHHHHRSKESSHTKIDSSSRHRESHTSRKHSKRYRHHSSHDQIGIKNPSFKNNCESTDDNLAVQSSPMLVWSDDHDESPIKDLSQKEKNTNNQDQKIFLHCVGISDDEELIGESIDSHEYKKQTDDYCKTNNEKIEEKVIEEEKNSYRNEKEINPVEPSVSEASSLTVHDKNNISKKSQDSETSKILKPTDVDVASFENSDVPTNIVLLSSKPENTVELGIKTECTVVPLELEKEPIPEDDVPIGIPTSNIGQYVTSFKANDSPPNVGPKSGKLEKIKSSINDKKVGLNINQTIKNNCASAASAESQSELDSNSMSKNFCELDANAALSDKQLDVDDQSRKSKKDNLVANSKKIEEEENEEKIETEMVTIPKYKEQEQSCCKNLHSKKKVEDFIACESSNDIGEKVVSNDNSQEVIPVELEEQTKHKSDGKAELLHTLNSSHPSNQHVNKNKSLSINKQLSAEKENDFSVPLNSSKESDEKAELHHSSQPSSLNTNENLSTNERSTAEEDVQFISTKGYKVEKLLTAYESGESPQKITNYEKTVSERKPVKSFEQNIRSESLLACMPIINESIQPIDDGQLSLSAKKENGAYASINVDKGSNVENEPLNDKESNVEKEPLISMHSSQPSNFHNEITNSQNFLTNELSTAEKDGLFASPNENVGSPQEISNNENSVFEGKQDTLSENEPVKSIYDGQLSMHLNDEECYAITHEVRCKSSSKPNNTPTNEQISSQITNLNTTSISIPTADQSVSNSTTELDRIRSLPSLVSPQKVPNSGDGFESSHSHSDSVSSGRRKKIKTPRKHTEDSNKTSNATISMVSGRYTYPKDVSRSVSTPSKYDLTSLAVSSKTVSGHRDEDEGNIAGFSQWTEHEGPPDSRDINPTNTPRLETKTCEETLGENKLDTNGSPPKTSHVAVDVGQEILIRDISQEEQKPKDGNKPEKDATNLENESSKQTKDNGACTLLVVNPSKNTKEIQPPSSKKALLSNLMKSNLQKDQQHNLFRFKNDECYEKISPPETKAKDKESEEKHVRNTCHIESEIKQYEKLDVQQVKFVHEETKIKNPQANEFLISSKLGEVKTKEDKYLETNMESFSITFKSKRTDKESANHCTDFTEAISNLVNDKNNEINNHNCEKNSTSGQICKYSTSPLITKTEPRNNSASASKNSKRNLQQKPVKQHQMMKHFMDSDYSLVGTCNYQSMSCSDEGAIEKPAETNVKKRKRKNETLTDALDCDFKEATTGSSSKSYARISPNLHEKKTLSKQKYKRKITHNLDSSSSTDDLKNATSNIEDPLKIFSVDYDNNPQESKVLKDLEGFELKEPIKKRKLKKRNSNICPVSKNKDNNLPSDSTEILTNKIKSLEKSPLSQIESDELNSSHGTIKSVDEMLDKLHSQNETTELRLKECLHKLSKDFLESSGEFKGKTVEESSQRIPQFPSDEIVDVIGSSSYDEKEQNKVNTKRSKATRRQTKRKLSAEEAVLQPKRSKNLPRDGSSSPTNTCDTTSCHVLEKNQCKSEKEQQRWPAHEKCITAAITPTHHKIFLNDVFPDDPPPVYSANDDDAQYQELDNRMRSLFQSPSYAQSVNGETSFDQRNDGRGQVSEDSLTFAETLNQSEKSECDTSSRKVSLGPNEYVIESVGTHTANVFITRKRCKKRTKVAGSGV